MGHVLRFLKDEGGANSIEYGVIGTLISIMLIAGATAIGSKLNAKWMGPLAGALN